MNPLYMAPSFSAAQIPLFTPGQLVRNTYKSYAGGAPIPAGTIFLVVKVDQMIYGRKCLVLYTVNDTIYAPVEYLHSLERVS